jgi:hypothetical protein
VGVVTEDMSLVINFHGGDGCTGYVVVGCRRYVVVVIQWRLG